ILELKLDHFDRLACHRNLRDIPFLLEDVRDALLHFGVRYFNGGQQRALRIADPCQHVRNRVNHKITSSPSSHQESIHSTPPRGTSNANNQTCASNPRGVRSTSNGSP